eukprot:m.159955 g.159955  ORF g.159955 m.159955 type:complete len:910 (+) comp15161_c0_seq6:1426-4155(+)
MPSESNNAEDMEKKKRNMFLNTQFDVGSRPPSPAFTKLCITKGPTGLYDTAESITGIDDPSKLVPVPTGKPLPSTAWGPEYNQSKVIAIMTSGGDSPGMNAAVRSCVATCLSRNVKVFAIYQGYKGLVEGGDHFRNFQWQDIDDIIQKGGTILGTDRCMTFHTQEGRKKACFNLASRGITALAVIGGDGSLTGANIFKSEWQDHVKALIEDGEIKKEDYESLKDFHIVGMVGSIDNDMCGFSMTIGVDTALHRIVAACDALITTAQSHERTFIVEVMGRNCGYLALTAAISVGADWVFVPESPPPMEDWETALCDSLAKRRLTCNYTMVILAEGATDRVRRPIKSDYIKALLTKRLGHDTRVTTLGHVQRGGPPSAADRIQGSRVGAEAALCLLSMKPNDRSRIVGMRWNQVFQIDLEESVRRTRELGKALEAKQFEKALKMRGHFFKEILGIYWRGREKILDRASKTGKRRRVVIVHAGAPAAGMNAVTKAVVRELYNRDYHVLAARDGFMGLAQGHLVEMSWHSVSQWAGLGGCKLGTNRVVPEQLNGKAGPKIIGQILREHEIQGVMVIGGFEAYESVLSLYQASEKNSDLRIPMCVLPATISNNVPGTEMTIGSDTALNAIVDAIDRLKLSAASSRGRVFLVQTLGGYCGYLATMGAMAGGADISYIHEDVVSLEHMQKDIAYLRRKFSAGFKKAVLVRNEKCSRLYDMAFMQKLYEQEGVRRNKIPFSVRNITLGHLQQGNQPSPLDRVRAARLANAGCIYIRSLIEEDTEFGPKSMQVVGIMGDHMSQTPVSELVKVTDFTHRRAKKEWFHVIQPLIRTLELNSEDKWGDLHEFQSQSQHLQNSLVESELFNQKTKNQNENENEAEDKKESEQVVSHESKDRQNRRKEKTKITLAGKKKDITL